MAGMNNDALSVEGTKEKSNKPRQNTLFIM